ncbi:DoxX family protein [Cellulomonas oligotrophica]|uniref:Putative membrane protein n=1 Tax=Cellulomonas oligotrophica TaxID=931536 RepID=A0A7Y9JZ96_9CELL|nr:DoxX family protein [Cellulomonas oligotrophica]NYD85970.1 putative membrane protein [Cellulomonas oligotrophica]GIG31022.1 hypothetical protein Col01nite_01810 [Cellulomonas oligotrophica]
MHVALWVVQALLALAFLAAGGMKLTRPKDALATALPWSASWSTPALRALGAVEVLGALGLVLPGLTGIATVLTPVAAVGLAVTMAGAVVLHLRRGETSGAAPSLVLLLLAALVAWGRLGPWPL